MLDLPQSTMIHPLMLCISFLYVNLYKKSYNVNVEIARFYNVYGPGENIDEKFGNVLGIWRSKLIKGEPLQLLAMVIKKEILSMFMI